MSNFWMFKTDGQKSFFSAQHQEILSLLALTRRKQPFCRIAGHTRAKVQEILATLETLCRETFPQFNLCQWADSIYGWLTHRLIDPAGSGRVILMKLVSNALEWSYEAGEQDVSAERLKSAAELLTLGRNIIRLIDGAGPTVEIPPSDTAEQESGQEAEAGEPPTLDPPIVLFQGRLSWRWFVGRN